MAVDVVGYSRLMGRDESGTLARLREHRKQRFKPTLARYGGRLVKLTGDGALVEFASAVDALGAAIEFQQAMAEANQKQAEDAQIVFRVGLHLGDLIVEGDDLYGDGVNVATRLEAEAPSGGVVISRNVQDAVAGRLKATFVDFGSLALKNIERPIQAFRVGWDPEDWKVLAPSTTELSVSAVPPQTEVPLTMTDRPSIAVLPFQNLSGDPEQEYFVDGLVEDIIAALSHVPGFFVVARNSSFTYKGHAVDVRQVGRELGVRYVLEGSVRKSGRRLRIAGQLIDTSNGNHIWAERYDGALEDVFDLQDKISSRVVAVIEPKVQWAEIARTKARSTDSLTAYELYLRALALHHESKEETSSHALALLDRAVTIDPCFSSAYGLMANLRWTRLVQNWGSADEDSVKGYEAATLAIETGKDDPDALARGALGIALLGGKIDESLAYIERALALNPNSLLAWRFGGWVCKNAGQHEKAIERFERAMQLSPMDAKAFDIYSGIAQPYFFMCRYEEALAWAKKALQERPKHPQALLMAIVASAMAGRTTEETEELIQRLLLVVPGYSVSTHARRMGISRQVDRDLYESALRLAGLPE
jgi:TolB-like protein/class 3 adenylate cyclase